MKRLVALAATALGLGGLGLGIAVAAGTQATQATATSADAPVKSITWGACPANVNNYGQPSLQCGTLQVPEDYARPNGNKITLAVSRLPHSGAGKTQGVILVNPGGPGGSGTGFAARVGGGSSPAMRAAYDFIGFDPRGVGNSTPAISCDPAYGLGPRPDYQPSAGTEQKWLALSKGYAAACGKKYGDFLNHVKTTDAARDMDSIRQALGEQQINYYGASYGTYLGSVYATLFPKKVRRMILDGVVRPSGVWYDDNLDQDVAFDINIDHFFGWLAKWDTVYHLGKTPADVRNWYYQTYKQLSKKPEGAVGPDELTDFVQDAAYRDLASHWLPEAAALAAYKAGNHKPLIDAATPTPGDNLFSVYLAVQCTDKQWPTDWRKWQRDNTALNKKYPFETWGNAWYNAPCAFWKGKAGTPVKVGDTRNLPKNILLMESRYDAATPYSGALEMQKLLKGSRLVIEDNGRTHVITHRGNPKVDQYYEDYFLYGKLPSSPQVHVASLGDPVPPPSPTTTLPKVNPAEDAR